MNKLEWLHRALTALGLVLGVWSTAIAQESATADVPVVIRAGEDLKFTIRLDEAPSIDGNVQFTVIGPDTGFSAGADAKAGRTDCPASILIPEAATGGMWRLHIEGFFTGAKLLPLKSTDVDFEVVPNEHLVFPTGAEVRINLSQVQLLRTAAARLQLQVQNFKAALAPYNEDSAENNRAVLKIIQKNIDEAMKSLDATQSSFHALAGEAAQSAAEQAFFDDLRTSYELVLARFEKGHFYSGRIASLDSTNLIEVAQTTRPEEGHTILAEAALHPFEQNELAYEIVADTQSLRFDLKVRSNPQGAEVCYHKRGDPCHPNPENTDTTIKSLVLGVYLVQFKKTGYVTEEREHDPYTDPNHEIDVELQPQ